MKISVGKKYRCKRVECTYHILLRSSNRTERQYLGVTEDGATRYFDEHGRDGWFECGGSWFELDGSTGEPTMVSIEGLSC